MKSLLLFFIILLWYNTQETLQQIINQNYDRSIYYNPYLQKRTLLQNYKTPYNAFANIHGPSNLASYAYTPPRMPQWALIYNRLASKRRQQIEASQRMVSAQNNPLQATELNNKYQTSNLKTAVPDRRMRVQNRKPQNPNTRVNSFKPQVNQAVTQARFVPPRLPVAEANRQSYNRGSAQPNRNFINQNLHPGIYPKNVSPKISTPNPLSFQYAIGQRYNSLSYLQNLNKIQQNNNVRANAKAVAPKYNQKPVVNKKNKNNRLVPQKQSYLSSPAPSKSKDILMSMPTKLIFLQKKARNNIYNGNLNPYKDRLHPYMERPNPYLMYNKTQKYSVLLHPLSSTKKISFDKSLYSTNINGVNMRNIKKSLITSSNKYSFNTKSKTFYPHNINNSSTRTLIERKLKSSSKTNQTYNNDKRQRISSISSSYESGWKRHHVFHPSFRNYKGDNEQWTYKRHHVYHQHEPYFKNTKQRERFLIPVAFEEDENSLVNDDVDDVDEDADADDDGGDVSFMGDTVDDSNNEDLPFVKPRLKIPIVNIETPNMNGLPEKVKQQIQATAQPVYKIVNGNVKSFKEIREPVFSILPYHKLYKDVDSVRKSFVGDDSLFNDYVPNENEMPPRRMPSDKNKMSEEELEAFKEDQAANSLIKSAENDKSKQEEPEVIGFDKHGMSAAADKTMIASHLANPALVDTSVAGDAMDPLPNKIDPLPNKIDQHRPEAMHRRYKGDANKYGGESETGMNQRHSSNKASSSTFESRTSRGKKKASGGLVDKNKISDSDMDFRHPVSELDAIENLDKDKFNDYEQYGNRESEDQLPPRDDMDMSDRYQNMEHNDERNSRGDSRGEGNDIMKPIEYTMKQGEENVAEAIRKLESGDSFDPDKMPPSMMDELGKKHFHHDRESDEEQEPVQDRLSHSENHGKEMYSHDDHDYQRDSPRRKLRHRESSEHLHEHEQHFDHDQSLSRPDHDQSLSRPDHDQPLPRPEHEQSLARPDHDQTLSRSDHDSPSSRLSEQVPMSENNMDDPSNPGTSLKPGMSLEDVLDPEKAEERASHFSEQVELSKKMDKPLPMDKGLELPDIKAPQIASDQTLGQGLNPFSKQTENENLNSRFSKQPSMLLDNQMGSKQGMIDEPPPNQQFMKTQQTTDEMIPRNYHQKLNEVSDSPKQIKEQLQVNTIKTPELTPEDAIHALNNKKSFNDILANLKDEDHYGPPDAVVNAQFNKNAKANDSAMPRFLAPNIIESSPVLNKTDAITNDLTKSNSTITNPLKKLENVLQAVRNSPSQLSPSNTANQSVSSLLSNPSAPRNINTSVSAKKESDDLQISEIQNATVTKEVVSILESLGQLRPASNLTVPIENLGGGQTSTNSASPITDNIKPDQANNKTSTAARDITSSDTNKNKVLAKTDAVNNNATIDNNSTEDVEEKETKEAVHDLNIAISILEKKLSLISAAKKSGNKKAIYIVDETLRNAKPVTKSVIATHKNTSKEGVNNITSVLHFMKNGHVRRHKPKHFPVLSLNKKKHFKKSDTSKNKGKLKAHKRHKKHSFKNNKKVFSISTGVL